MKRAIFWAAIGCLTLVAGGALKMVVSEPQLTETVLANRDHDNLVSAISALCGTDAPANSSPRAVLASFRAPLAPDTGIADIAKPLTKLTAFQMAAVNYSSELKDQRIKLDHEITTEESQSWWFKVAIALCGGLASITMGLKPLFDKHLPDSVSANFLGSSASLAAAAIILSGTVGMLSSVSSFAEAQANLFQHQRTLAQLQQLHWRVGNDVFAATHLCIDNADLGKVGAWKYRFEEITNEAMPSITRPGDTQNKNPDVKDVKEVTVARKSPD
jgi:hypothetical protein